MDLKRYTHADVRDVRLLLLDIDDEAYVDDLGPLHSRERFSYLGADDGSCVERLCAELETRGGDGCR